MTGLMQDFRYALRQMRKSPAFFLVVVLTLGLGIGANTAIFSMVDWLVLRTLPIAHPEEMHFLAFSRPGEHSEVEFSYPEFLDIQKQTTDVFSGLTPFIFGGLAGEQNSQSGLTADGTTQAVQTAYVGGDFFSVMGLTPAAGRFILSSEGKAVGADPVVVLSYSYWQNRFSADPAIIGKAVSINGHPVTIIGVAPKGFLGPTPILETQAYLPLSQFMIERGIAGDFLANPKARSMEAIARVKPGAEIKQVQSKLAVVGQHLLKQFPRDRGIGELGASPLRGPGIIAGENPFPKLAALFLILATLVLALACVNVANLFLVRAAARRREMAVRAALGAGSGRLVRQLLTESLVVAALSCILGALLGSAATRLLGSINMQSELPLVFDFAFNWHVFAYAFAVAAFTAAFVVVVPAARVRHGNLREVLHEGGRTSTGGRQRLRDILVAAQVGGSLTLLIVAGLFVRSLRGVQRADLGFDPVHVLNVTLDPNEIGYTEAQGRAFYRAVLERTRALPGVESASLASVVPLSDSVQGSDLAIPGYVTSTDQQAPHAETDAVSPNYFATMRITLKSGRDFTDADNENSSRVVVINQAMADRFWPGQDVLGKSFALTSDLKRPVTIVGVVQNSRMSQLYGVFEPIFYLPVTQSYVSTETLQIRSERNTQDAVAEVRSIAQSLAPAIPLYGVRTMTEALHGGNGLLFFELGASLAAGLGLLGLILAVVGVYGVMSYAVSQRTQEIGVRIALGAQKRDILQMIGSRGAVIVASGLTVGLLAALAVGRLVSDFLVGITPSDPITYVGVSFLLAMVACLATYIPTRRATKVDPMVALRYE
ncbi:MAG TPA: ABC transporter permease [Candidatus Acidoferrum sp.]|nr:ABC transporter permease [Candidatus Acidoferrum sp.]